MYRISKEFHFSASHQLIGLPEDHQCARLHGHNYIVVVELTAEDAEQPRVHSRLSRPHCFKTLY